MKQLAMLLAMPFVAFAANVVSLPSPGIVPFEDTEAETNIVLTLNRDRLDRVLFALELTASATNCLEVAIGADTDDDGNLSPEESDVAFGYDCGEWFLRGDDSAEAVCAVEGERVSREFVFRKRAFSPEWNIVRVTRRGLGDVAECVSFTEERQRFMLFVR